MEDFLERLSEGESGRYPVILIGQDLCRRFMETCRLPVHVVSSSEDCRRLVAYWQMIPEWPHPLVVGDMSNLRAGTENLFLKFVEEQKNPIIFLSSVDVCSSVFLSRMARVEKISGVTVSSGFRSAKDAVQMLAEGGADDAKQYEEMVRACPKLYFLQQKVSRKYLGRLIQVIE